MICNAFAWLLLRSFLADVEAEDIDGLDDDDVSFLMLGKDTLEILGRRDHLLLVEVVELLLLVLLRRLKLMLPQC